MLYYSSVAIFHSNANAGGESDVAVQENCGNTFRSLGILEEIAGRSAGPPLIEIQGRDADSEIARRAVRAEWKSEVIACRRLHYATDFFTARR